MHQVNAISSFNLKRSKILSKLKDINEILIKQGLDKGSTDSIIEKLVNNTFSIIVVGEFSSGKSTFINALLREKLLPAKVLPTTAIINIIEDGDPEAVVYYKDKTVKEIDIKEIQGFATALNEKGKEEASKIEHMLIRYPCEYTKEGVKIIDTPGVEDLDKTREEITYNMIPKSDAAILLLDARRVLKNSEIVFIKDKIIGNNINKLFFVINFADAICGADMKPSEEKLQAIVSSTLEQLKIITENNDIKLHALSAKKALFEAKNAMEGIYTEKFKGFEQELQQFLITEKGDVLLNNAVKRANIVIEDTARVVNFKIASLNRPLEELKVKERELTEIIDTVRTEKLLIKQDVNNAFNGVITSVIPEIDRAMTKAISRVEAVDIPDECQDIEGFYKNKFKDLLTNEMEDSVNSKIQENLKTIIVKTENRLSVLVNHLNNFMEVDFTKDALHIEGVKINSFIDNKDLTMKQLAMGVGAYFAVPFIFSLISTATIILIPVIIGYILSGVAIFKWGNSYKKNAVINSIKDAREEISKGIAEQLKSKMTSAALDYGKTIDSIIEGKICDTSAALEQVMNEKKQLSHQEESLLKDLGSLGYKLNKIKAELLEIFEGEDINDR